MDETAREQIEQMIASHDVALFMKGNRQQPQCGFSATVVRILDTLVPHYGTYDVLADPGLRENIKIYSSWPTIPQLYVKGEFVGGCDIVQELFESGELAETLGVDLPRTESPRIEISDAAAERLREAIGQQGGPGRGLHLGIDARFQANLFIGPAGPGDLSVESNGVTLLLDRVTAARADGITIDLVDTPQSSGFQISNPNAPKVHELSVEQLREMLERGDALELIDVRTDEERATAAIPQSVQLTDAEAQRIEALPRDTVLVFHCHQGGRSLRAGEHFAALGFTRVYNLVGGIDAWAERIDPSVDRY